MSSIASGQLLTLDPSDKRVLVYDWDQQGLPGVVTISTSTWTITAIHQNGATALTKDQESIVSGSRKTQVRLLATTATAGDRYRVSNAIVTSESPAQTIEQSFTVLVQDQ
jgi:hypothetical protein